MKHKTPRERHTKDKESHRGEQRKEQEHFSIKHSQVKSHHLSRHTPKNPAKRAYSGKKHILKDQFKY